MKTKKLFAFAFVAAAFITGAYAQRKTIVSFNPILRYVDASESDSIQNNINQGFVDGLKKYGRFRITDGTTLDTTQAMIRKSESAEYDETNIIAAGKATNADYLCYSKVVKVGSQYNVYFNLLETQTGIPIGTYEEDCTYRSVTSADVVNRAVLKILEEDLRGQSSNPDTIIELRGSKVKSNSNPISRDGDFKISFLPPAIKSSNARQYKWVQEVLPGRMVNGFFTYSSITPLDIGTEATVIKKIRESESSFYDENTIKEAGKLAQAPFYVYTVITDNGSDDFTFYAVLNHTKTGEAIATFRENCTFQQIRDKEECNIVNRMVYSFVKKGIGTGNVSFNDYIQEGLLSELKKPRVTYALENVDALGRELEQQKKGVSEKQQARREEQRRQQAEAARLAKQEADELAKLERQQEREIKRAERKAAMDELWDSRPARGLDFTGGYYSNNIEDGMCEDGKWGANGFVGTFAWNSSIFLPNWLCFGIRADFMLLPEKTTEILDTSTLIAHGFDSNYQDDTYWAWDLLFQATACFPITPHIAPYVSVGIGTIGFQTDVREEEADSDDSYYYSTPEYNYYGDYEHSFTFMAAFGSYFPVVNGVSLHAEYIIQNGGKYMGWEHRISGGITVSLIGWLASIW